LDQATGRLHSHFPQPLLEPELDWECWGDVNNVVFVQGAHCDGDDVCLTYSAADRCVGVATRTLVACSTPCAPPPETRNAKGLSEMTGCDRIRRRRARETCEV